MRLADLVAVSRRVADTRARLQKTELLAGCLAALAPEERAAGVAFLAGAIRQGRIGLGGAALRAAHPGRAALTPTLTVAQVDAAFADLAALAGPGSARGRSERLGGLLGQATADEQAWLTALVYGELRQGAQEGVLVEAVARAAGVDPQAVRRAAMLAGDVVAVAVAALDGGAASLAAFRLQLLTPVQPMLAGSAEDVGQILERHGRVALEDKLDGARVQVHRVGGDVRVFTRQLHDVTAAVPEVVAAVLALPVSQVVLDGEALVRRADGRPAPFQTTMRRFGRRLDVERLQASLPLSSVSFDCLHLDGQDLIDRPAADRWAALESLLPEAQRVPHAIVEDTVTAQAFVERALAAGHEGVMAKAVDAPYEAGRRGTAWLKLKPVHTLDLVVLAVEWGSGRRTGWLSNLHLGARDPETGGFVMLGKTFKGMTDEVLRWQTEKLLEFEIGRDGHVVHVRPELVAEIAFDGLQASPHYPGGLALRFARLKRYRPDKAAAAADTIDTVRQLYAHQVE